MIRVELRITNSDKGSAGLREIYNTTIWIYPSFPLTVEHLSLSYASRSDKRLSGSLESGSPLERRSLNYSEDDCWTSLRRSLGVTLVQHLLITFTGIQLPLDPRNAKVSESK